MSLLGDRLLAIHHGLEAAAIPHAFGGAIALAYCTEEPRGTRDIDVNVFLDAAEAGAVARVLGALPDGVASTTGDLRTLQRDGQGRLWWSDTPVDLFFDVHEFHRQVPLHVRTVPFADHEIPILGCEDLAIFKAMFARTKDWADLEAMAEAGSLDLTTTIGWVTRLLGPEHESVRRLAALLR